MQRFNQKGFEAVGVIVAVLFLAIVGFAGYKVMDMNKSASTTTETASTVKPAEIPETIKTEADLTQTGKALDNSGTQLENSLSESSLDADVDSML